MTFAVLEITVLKFPDIFRVSITIRPGLYTFLCTMCIKLSQTMTRNRGQSSNIIKPLQKIYMPSYRPNAT